MSHDDSTIYDDDDNDLSFDDDDDILLTTSLFENLPTPQSTYFRTYYDDNDEEPFYNDDDDAEKEEENLSLPSPSPSPLPQFSFSNQQKFISIKLYIHLINTNIHIYNTNMISFKSLISHLSAEYTRIYNYNATIVGRLLDMISKLFVIGKYNHIYYTEIVVVVTNYLKNYALFSAYIFSLIASYIRNLEKTLMKHAWFLIRAIWLLYHIRVFFGNLPEKRNYRLSDLSNVISEAGQKITQTLLDQIFQAF